MSIDRQTLDRLCGQHGVLTGYHDIWGRFHPASDESLIAILAELDVDASHPESVSTSSPGAPDPVDRRGAGPCFEPAVLAGDGRVWGPAIQLYAVRSQRNWGIGDFGDLLVVIEQWAGRGASLVGLNPLHALFAHNPLHISPYSPSSRLQLNTLYIDVEAIPELTDCAEAQGLVASAEFQAQLALLRASERVRYAEVAALKTTVLRLLHAHFSKDHDDARPRAVAYGEFVRRGGSALQHHARFEAIQGYLHATDPSVWGWPVWPEPLRSPDAPAVAAFAAEHADDVDFHAWLQWLADEQLGRARRRCAECGMAIGLYLDLAVSVDRAGSDAWSHAGDYARGASIGAPPDEINPKGQNWGLPPLRPDRSKASGHALFAQTLRAVMRHAGALRIDHVMGLMRLFWIPPGQSATSGAYVRYPLDELVELVAEESRRHRCLVIGEDLGTVADEIRVAMERFELLSYRILYFERDGDGAFKAPEEHPRRALMAVSTHDLPTLAGWWSGHDLAVRQRLGLFPADTLYEQQLAGRAQERVRLLIALERAGLLPEGIAPGLDGAARMTPALAEAIHAYAASSRAEVMLVQLEDVLGLEDQANLPGTVDEHPNWQQRLPLSLEAQASDPRFASLARRLASLRPRPTTVETAPAEAIVPRATYRLQFHSGFRFDDALRILPYLHRLGVSHVYCSPILRARAGSTHGYDVVSHHEINPELGGSEGFARFSAGLRELGMGQLLDLVPNHMGIGPDNAWWMDVLENGPSSRFSGYFDIDWHPVNPELEGKVLLPVLGQQYGSALASGELALSWDAASASLSLAYHEHRFPLDRASYADTLREAVEAVADDALRAQLQSLATAHSHLPSQQVPAASAEADERRRDQGLLQQRLVELTVTDERAAIAVAAAVAVINAEPSKDRLHALHERQAYRLAFWRVAGDEINYRRFFDINELAGLRMEDEAVFEATQGFSLDLAAAGTVDGLRIDHPDGLQNPAEYFGRLQEGFARRAGRLGADGSVPDRPLYVVAEKIAAAHEDVPSDWRIHGTTGYRFAMVVNGVLVDTSSEAAFDAIWSRMSGDRLAFAEMAYQGKRRVASTSFASELTVLATALLRIAKGSRETRDYTYNSLRSTLAEIAACMPVYRTYVVERPSVQDDRLIAWAVAQARRRSVLADLSIFDFAERCIRNDEAPPVAGEAVRQFALRFQQFCSPVAAKGVEDTAFYRYHRLVSLNEVGGDPGSFGITVKAFHAANADRGAQWPDTIIATSTHDNKRSEDVRCRLDVLSEMPAEWDAALTRWGEFSAAWRARMGDAEAEAPSLADQYLFYQTVLGTLPAEGLDEETLPAYRERIAAYMTKAVREAKEHSSWTLPNVAYEEALAGFIAQALGRVRPNPWLTDLVSFGAGIAWFGALNSLSMTLFKYTVPGVPDLYQGNELIDLSLVDPDNRRPVDYERRDALLAEIESRGSMAQSAPDGEALLQGRIKLELVHRLLELRRAMPTFFRRADYLPLTVTGALAEHVVAFARREGEQTLVVIGVRLFVRLLQRRTEWPIGAIWGDTAVVLPTSLGGTDVLAGKVLPTVDRILLSTAFSGLPAAVLLLRQISR